MWFACDESGKRKSVGQGRGEGGAAGHGLLEPEAMAGKVVGKATCWRGGNASTTIRCVIPSMATPHSEVDTGPDKLTGVLEVFRHAIKRI
jgi:hypothetical protein